MAGQLALHHHGKSRVRLGRVWREGNTHYMVEWTVHTMLESDMQHAFLDGDNSGMTSTDTQKNTVYVVAKRMPKRCSVEQFAIALAQHLVQTYPRVSQAKVAVEEKPWKRVEIDGIAHDHGFALNGTEIRTAAVAYDRSGKLDVTAGLKDLSLLKTTQSGYEGFIHDQYTTLDDCRDRMMASTVTATWKYALQPLDYDASFVAARKALLDPFFGPPRGGVYSPSVQYTLYRMGERVLQLVPQVQSIFLNMPNLHFIPCSPVTEKFANDVYVATSEPHGNIEAVVTRSGLQPHCRL